MLRYGKALLILPLIALGTAGNAQKKQYTMAEAVNGIGGKLAPQGLKGVQWRKGTHELWQQVDNKYLVRFFVNSNKFDTVGLIDSKSGMGGFKWLERSKWYFFNDKGRVTFGLDTPTSSTRTYQYSSGKEAANHAFASLGYAYTKENNLFFMPVLSEYWKPVNGIDVDADVREVAVTSDTNPNIINGQSVHRNEFGIDGGIFWSPKGNYLAYYRMDQTMVNDYPVIDWSVVPAKNENVKYPMAGGTSHVVSVRVYDPKTKKTIELKTGEGKDHYLTCVTWSPDEKYIFVGILNRKQNHLWLNQYDASTGEKIKTLFEETDDKYVEPQHPLSFLPGSNDQFVWWSQRDGFMHLYLYNTSGKLIKQLTKGNWVVNELLAFNAKHNEVIFTASKDDAREKHGYVVNWKSGKMRILDSKDEHGIHNYIASDDGEFFYEVYTGELSDQAYYQEESGYNLVDVATSGFKPVPKRSSIRSISGETIKVLLEAENPLAEYQRPAIIETTLKANDGTKLYGKLILPTDFSEKKKYPVIVYLYNGPHNQLIKNGFPESGNLWYEYLAQHGYIVWTMDGRGTANRGLKFEQATFRQLGTVEMEDQMVGVNYLKSLPYVDANRMGIHGWSFGGFMTTSFMLRKPDVFKAGVAGGPVMDWSMYEIMYGERYMDTPEENPEGYANSNLLTKTKNLKGKLLLIHGAQDATVVWQHSINFLKKSVDENVQVDYFVYPGYEHNVRGKDRVHLMQKVTDYFDLYLK